MKTADQRQSCAPPTTRASVLDVLRDTQDSYNDTDSLASLSRNQARIPSYDGATEDTLLHVNASFEEVSQWLDVQCDIEQSKADWTNEYGCNPRDGAKEAFPNGQGPDTTVLDRIRSGKGPRPAKYEDLLWPLRSEDSREISPFAKHSKNESYRDMEQVLRDWNKHVAIAYEDMEARKALIDAMYERIDFLDLLISKRRSPNTYDPTSNKLLDAIHAYRSETIAFKTTDTYDLLTIILAHIGYTIPDIDKELKFLIFYTLVTERINVAHEANAPERHRREDDIARAKQQRDAVQVSKLEKRMMDWQRKIFQQNCDVIANKVKVARRNVAARVSEELQNLAVLQTAQKMVLNGRLSGSRSIPALSVVCDTTATALAAAADAKLPPLLASSILASQNNHDMEYIARARIRDRAKKFSGLDKENMSKDERDRLVEERMANPDTVNMMENAIKGIAETRTKAKEMLKVMETMDTEIDEVLDKAQQMMEVYESLDNLMGPEPVTEADVSVDSRARGSLTESCATVLTSVCHFQRVGYETVQVPVRALCP